MANQENKGQQGDTKPTGTSRRQTGNDTGEATDARRGDQNIGENPRRNNRNNDDEESGLGNRNTFR